MSEPEDVELAELDRKREELAKQNPDTAPMVADTPDVEEDLRRTQIGTVFGSGS
ncbi:MAG TPA: hypothetical protein VEU28_07785 [Actinomycetota bacterium]|nr:hypothetical protein [Actinomycetota bacterium]